MVLGSERNRHDHAKVREGRNAVRRMQRHETRVWVTPVTGMGEIGNLVWVEQTG